MGSREEILVEVGQHKSEDDSWMVINGTVWDITGFAPRHPGGADIIREYFGRDASEIYNELHGPALVANHLGEGKRIGVLCKSSADESSSTRSSTNVATQSVEKPSLQSIVNLYDFEAVARETLSARAWAYFSGATNDCFTAAMNIDWYARILFRPRVLTGLKEVDSSTTILEHKYSLPIFNAPASMAKLAHPDGELALARATAGAGTTIIAPTMASFSIEEIVDALPPHHPFFFQLYVNKDRSVTEELLESVCKLKPRAIMVTVDLPVLSKRESNERYEIGVAQKTASKGATGVKGKAQARSASNAIEPNVQWKDIRWIKEATGVPIFIKGIQCAMDARLAYENGCAGIYLSNHGGRAVDTAPPSLLTLLEIQANCPEILEKMEVFIDGGIRRGTDVLKAICLGASAVCLGRPFFYALGYGQEGVEHALGILKDELETAMLLVGITSLDQAHPGLLITADVDRYIYQGEGHPFAKHISRSRL
ncbi:L-lactate dehydrogenase [Leptodontidium sp. MPI-SDFR-AT-0119]|nr:L-lactate dehydrogenase [Leptodontidium sp. MPI-SDFR-AT-0119]